MDTLKILQASDQANWDYDDEADVLYLSVGEPRLAVGVDIGDGVVLRYDEATQVVVGLTVVGLRAKLAKAALIIVSATQAEQAFSSARHNPYETRL